jgi:hypothetical protein
LQDYSLLNKHRYEKDFIGNFICRDFNGMLFEKHICSCIAQLFGHIIGYRDYYMRFSSYPPYYVLVLENQSINKESRRNNTIIEKDCK